MKNLSIYSIFLLFGLLCFSCVKEQDLISEGETELIPQEGETKLLTGIVKDTSGVVIPEASVKLILDELEIEVLSDENGEWNLTVPSNLTEGYVVANKIEYSKSIQRFNETANHQVEEIFLTRDPDNLELDLGFVESNIITVLGRITDQNGIALPSVNLFLISVVDILENEYEFNAFGRSSSDGSFELIYEDNDYMSTTLYGSVSTGCSDILSIELEGVGPVEDLGAIQTPTDNFDIFQTSLVSDGSSCYGDVSILSYFCNSETSSRPIIYNEPLGDIQLEYCANENGYFYMGVESDDNAYFNGDFVKDGEIASSYSFDICTPNDGEFLELNVGDEYYFFDTDLSFQADRTVVAPGPAGLFVFSVLRWVKFVPLGADTPAYEIGEFRSLSLPWANQFEFSNIEDDRPVNFVNIVQDDDNYFSGIAFANLVGNDGNEVDIRIRFRVAK